MPHIYSCKLINNIKPNIDYNEIYNGNFKNQMEILRRMTNNLEKRNQMKEKEIYPCDPCDPPYCQYGIG